MGIRGPKARSPEERFWDAVVKVETGCWLFRDRADVYGQLADETGRPVLAHRFSYRLHHGDIPVGLFVCHKCDVRGCVNPEHLYAGTHEENTRDIVERKRYRRPVARVVKKINRDKRRGGNRKLMRAEKQKIKDEYATGEFSQAQLAHRWSVSQATISATIRGVNNCGSSSGVKRRVSSNFRSKITEQQRQEIREKYATGAFTQTKLAVEYGVTQARVSDIITGRDYKRSITPETPQ